jgi:hypothetical protein
MWGGTLSPLYVSMHNSYLNRQLGSFRRKQNSIQVSSTTVQGLRRNKTNFEQSVVKKCRSAGFMYELSIKT